MIITIKISAADGGKIAIPFPFKRIQILGVVIPTVADSGISGYLIKNENNERWLVSKYFPILEFDSPKVFRTVRILGIYLDQEHLPSEVTLQIT